MNCRDLQSYFEERSLVDDAGGDCAEVAEHLSICANCRLTVETQKETASRLRLLRDSAPAIPLSLDAAILAKYRQQISARRAFKTPSRQGIGLANWRWATGLVAALLVFAAIFILRKPLITTKTVPHTTRQAHVALPPQSAADVPPRETVGKDKDQDTGVTRRAHTGKTNIRANQPTLAAVSAETQEHSLPEGFRSLLYCDELSCDGGMEVVRVQLPSPGAGFMSSSASGNHVVSAEVLVGADGFARGIRIVH
jgi:hypothetical protein